MDLLCNQLNVTSKFEEGKIKNGRGDSLNFFDHRSSLETLLHYDGLDIDQGIIAILKSLDKVSLLHPNLNFSEDIFLHSILK